MVTRSFDAIILGGGAAGLMCAIEAGKRGKCVAVLERAASLGKKILISGGGRCNFTNIHCGPENFICTNPHFSKSALARYTPADFIALIEKHGIQYHEKKLGQLFCDRSARDILNLLEDECKAATVSVFPGMKIEEVSRPSEFVVRTASTDFRAPVLVVATGGLSIPKLGATSFGYELARQFGVKIRNPWPGLVPLVFSSEDHQHFCDLTGVAADVIASCDGQRFREKLLITHRGLSGPAILQISSYWSSGKPIVIDLAPEREAVSAFEDRTLPRNASTLRAELRKFMPIRLADRWLELHRLASWANQALRDFDKQLHSWTVMPAGTEGYDKAEVTAGGIDTDELSPKTMECRKVPGLYFIGEVVDVTGQLGGFNFQWAWASGAAAGRAL